MKKLIRYVYVLGILFGLSLLISTLAFAEETIFVEDQAGILSKKDKSYIYELNETKFKQLEGGPQYVVVALNNLQGETIEGYAEKKFQELGIGNQELDNGFLFVISLEDQVYRLETGYGVEAVITDSMKEEIVTEQVTALLDNQQYAEAVMAVTGNIEELVTERYGNYGTSLAGVEAEHQRNQQLIIVLLLIVGSLGSLILGVIGLYFWRKKQIQTKFEQYISPQLQVRVYSPKTEGTSLSFYRHQKLSDQQLSKVVATKTMSRPNRAELVTDSLYLKGILATYLVKDVVIAYWSSNRKVATYELEVYLGEPDIQQLVDEYGDQLFTSQSLLKNPLFSAEGHHTIEAYVANLTVKHQHSLAISAHNKGIVKEAVTAYLMGIKASFKDRTDQRLVVALMTYFLLEGRYLAEVDAIDKELLSQSSLSKGYEKAKKKRRTIESSYRRQAISDLDQMMIGSYYMQQAVIWSSYSSSSSSIGGGSSFGGGASGGGGFSGSW